MNAIVTEPDWVTLVDPAEAPLPLVPQRPQPVPQAGHDAASLIHVIAAAAENPNVDIDKMERLMAMHERMQARAEEAAFNDAMNKAQARMRPISADAANPQTKSLYATYGKLDSRVRPIYTDCGFSISFNEGDGAPEGHARILAYVSHSAGHTRTYKLDMPNDGKGAKGGDVMTKTHATGAAHSYGRRYLLKDIFNIAIGEEDNDGNGDDDAVDPVLAAFTAAALQGDAALRAHYEKYLPSDDFWRDKGPYLRKLANDVDTKAKVQP